jgi:isopenicillin N synthase-like dioxygenase
VDYTIPDDEMARYADFDNRYLSAGDRFGIERAPLKEIPTINFAPFVRQSSLKERLQVAAELRRACIDIGFFYLAGHGISQPEFDEVHAWGHRFFEQPLDEKKKLTRSRSLSGQGYIGVGGTNPEANSNKAPDLKETFSMGREVLPGEPEQGRFGAGLSQWPSLPGFREFLQAHIRKRVLIAQQLVRALALSLHLPETWFDEPHRYLGCFLLYNYYPPLERARLDSSQWSISPHTDYGSFTLLDQDALAGLQVRNASGAWIDVPPVRETFVVNIADLLARWTNDLYTSNLHRAANFNTAARISVPFFVFPQGTVQVSCLESCHSARNPPRYEAVVVEDYLRALLDQSDRTGRPGVSKKTGARLSTALSGQTPPASP